MSAQVEDLLPKSIRRSEKGFSIAWRDGHEAVYSFAHLRRNCPCATCRESPPKVVTEEDPLRLLDDVPIFAENAELVGNYAVRIFWNDGHSSGIYSYRLLRDICPCPECRNENAGA